MSNHNSSVLKLEKVMTLQRGYDLPAKDRKNGNIPVISSSGISGYHDTSKCHGENVITGRYGTIGEVFYYNGDCWPLNTALYVKDFHGNDPQYIYYLLKNVLSAYRVDGRDKSTVPGIDRNVIHQLDIHHYDDKTYQKDLCAVLKCIDELFDNNLKICSELESMAKTLYGYWFTQFDFPNAEGKPYRTSGGAMEWNEQLKREIPKGWEVGSIDSIMAIDNNSVDPSRLGDTVMEHYSIPAFDDGNYPAYEPANTIESGKYAVDRDCILTSKLNPHFKRLWDPYCDTDNAICSTEFIVYRPRETWTRPYCYAVLNSDGFYAHMVSRATASTGSRKRIQPDVSAAFQIAMPDEETMRSFVALYDPIMKQLKTLHKENHELAKLRDWLLPMLMNGQAVVE